MGGSVEETMLERKQQQREHGMMVDVSKVDDPGRESHGVCATRAWVVRDDLKIEDARDFCHDSTTASIKKYNSFR